MGNNRSSELVEQKQKVAGVFSRAAPTYDHIGPRYFSHFGRRLVELAQIPNGARVLDIATGRGAVLFPAAEAVGAQGHVIGIDLSSEMVDRSREEVKRLNLQNVEVKQMDAEQLEFPDESFDGVLCSFAIFFFPRLDRALAEMHRVLKPKGRIAVTTWGPKDEHWRWFGELIDAYLPPDEPAAQPSKPKYVFNTSEGLDAILTSGGFENIKILFESEVFTYGSEEEWWSTLWSHGLREDLEMIENKMGKDGLQRFQANAFKNIRATQQADGIPQSFSVLFGLAAKP